MNKKVKKFISLLLLISLFLTVIPLNQMAFAADPVVVANRVLSASMAGDSSDWIEIAQYGGHSLILRKNNIQASGFGSSNQYSSSTARSVVNNWFKNTLSSGARLRSFTVTNNAASPLYLGSWSNTGNGFSTPTGVAVSTGDDVAFLLSFAEAAIFCSTQYCSYYGSSYTKSSNAATANFNKLTPIGGVQPQNHWWLRSPGDPSYSGTSGRACTVGLGGFNSWGNDAMQGAVNQYQISSNIIGIRPALWVGSGIFDDTYTLTYHANGGNGAPPPQSAPANTVITLSYTIPTRTDHKFLGWSQYQNATIADYQPGGLFNIGVGNKVLYAVWGQDPGVTEYTLYYNANNGTGAPPSQRVPVNSNIAISYIIPTRPGYVFLGWSLNQWATIPDYQPGNVFNIGIGDKILYAIWGLQADIPEGVDGRILQPYKTGDTHNWIEIARYGNYSLIVRSRYINIRANNKDEDRFQFTPYFSSNNTTIYNTDACYVRRWINEWFNGTSAVENLANNARLRQYTMQNNAISTPGTSSTSAGLSNGFSKPTNTYAPTGTDVSFILSFGEAANFISEYRFVRDRIPSTEQSPYVAARNWAKIYIPMYTTSDFSTCCGAWLRSPGDLAGTMGALANDYPPSRGRAFQLYIDHALTRETGYVYPALWVEQGVFNEPEYTLYYDANGGTGAPPSIKIPTNTTILLSATRPTRPGFTFQGWALSSTATVAVYQPGDPFNIGVGDKTLYAVWGSAAAKIVVIHMSLQPPSVILEETFNIPAGPYGFYGPKTFPGYGPGQLASYSAPPSGNIGAGQTITIIYEYTPVRTVSGRVWPIVTNNMGFGNDFLRKHDIVVELRPTFKSSAAPGLSTTAYVIPTSSIDSVGAFTIENVPFGNYVLVIKRPGYLVRCMNVTISSATPINYELKPPGTADNGIFYLWRGDCSDDLRIESLDAMMITELMNVSYGDYRYNPACDLNADGIINSVDLMMVVEHFNLYARQYAGADDVNFDA